MRTLPALALVIAGCTQPEPRPEEEPPACAEGYLLDGEACVPETCGIGAWGELPVDGATVYVDASAPEGGDGSAEAPLGNIQTALDLAGSRGGGLVAVATGTYPETLSLNTDHAGVQLAGRCRELVTIDASVGGDSTPGVDVSAGYAQVTVSGLGIEGSQYSGLMVSSGVVRLEELAVEGNGFVGIIAAQSGLAPAVVEIQSCELADNTGVGVLAVGEGTEVSLEDTSIRDTRPTEQGEHGHGLDVYDGATLSAVGCTLVGNTLTGVIAFNAGTEVSLERTTIAGNLLDDGGQGGYGLDIYDGARLSAVDCELVDNATVGVLAADEGTEVIIEDCIVRDTRPKADGEAGHGLEAHSGATLHADGCTLERNGQLGVKAAGVGTEVLLTDTRIEDTRRNGDGEGGFGIEVDRGARLAAEGCTITGNRYLGVFALDAGTEVTLMDSIIRDTIPAAAGKGGYGIAAHTGAMLSADGCEVVGNTDAGIAAMSPGTELSLRDTLIRGTLPIGNGENGIGLGGWDGAKLEVERCELVGNSFAGIYLQDPHTELSLSGCSVRDTKPTPGGEFGFGVQVKDASAAWLERCAIERSSKAGLVVSGRGSAAALRDCTITGTRAGSGVQGATAIGLVAQEGATVTAAGLRVQDTEGPGVYSTLTGQLICEDCALLDNQFAGAAVYYEGSLELLDSTITGTTEGVDIGGGVGVYAAPRREREPPTLRIEDSIIADNRVAGAWLAGNGSYQIIGSSFSGSAGVPHGDNVRCGDGVYARLVKAWDGSAGLLLQEDLLEDNSGAGLFLNNASALLDGNSWSNNDLDLLVQGEACLSPAEDWAEAPTSEICPTWDRPTCPLEFSLTLQIAELPDELESNSSPSPTIAPLPHGRSCNPSSRGPKATPLLPSGRQR